jgi:hypothetical protein
MFVTLIVIFLITQEPKRILLFLTYALLVEGGLSLVTGGVLASFSPVIDKIGENVIHTKPWDAKRLKEAENQATLWILTGTFLFLFGLLTSAL